MNSATWISIIDIRQDDQCMQDEWLIFLSLETGQTNLR